MRSQVINHQRHSMYTYAMIQLSVETKKEFKSISKYMEQAYGPGIEHVRNPDGYRNYKRNAGDNKIWYYCDNTGSGYRFNSSNYKIYLTTPEQLTMVGLFFN